MRILNTSETKEYIDALPQDKQAEFADHLVLVINDSQHFFISPHKLKVPSNEMVNPNWVVKGFDHKLNPVVIKFQAIPEHKELHTYVGLLHNREVTYSNKIPDYLLSSGEVELSGRKVHFLVVKIIPGMPLYNPSSKASLEWFDPKDLSLQDKIDIVSAAIKKLQDFHFNYQVQHRNLLGDNVLVYHSAEYGWQVNFIDLGLAAGVSFGIYNDIKADYIYAAIQAVSKGQNPAQFLQKEKLPSLKPDIQTLINDALLPGLNITNESEAMLFAFLQNFLMHDISHKNQYSQFLSYLSEFNSANTIKSNLPQHPIKIWQAVVTKKQADKLVIANPIYRNFTERVYNYLILEPFNPDDRQLVINAFIDKIQNYLDNFDALPNARNDNQKQDFESFKSMIEKLIIAPGWQLDNLVNKLCLANLYTTYDRTMRKGYYYGYLGNRYDEHMGKLHSDYFSRGKSVMHIVEVLDGIGDFIHFKNWVELYTQRYPHVKSKAMIFINTSYIAIDNFIDTYICTLPDNHPLKDASNIIDAKKAEDAVTDALFNGDSIFANTKTKQYSEYKCLYAISNVRKGLRIMALRLGNLGLRSCYISEITDANSPHLMKVSNKDAQFYCFGIGKPSLGYAGCIFKPTEHLLQIDQIASTISTHLLDKLHFDESAGVDRTKFLASLNLIVGYYQPGRKQGILQSIIEEKVAKNTSSNRKPLVFLTGLESAPSEITQIIDKYAKKIDVTYGKLNEQDYNMLMQLVLTKHSNLFLCSGDNTFQESIALGKLPIYIFHSDEHLCQVKLSYFRQLRDYIQELYDRLIENDPMHPHLNYLQEIIDFYDITNAPRTNSLQYNTFPSNMALEFFADVLSPFLRRQFDINNNLEKIVESIEDKSKKKYLLETEYLPFEVEARANQSLKSKKPQMN